MTPLSPVADALGRRSAKIQGWQNGICQATIAIFSAGLTACTSLPTDRGYLHGINIKSKTNDVIDQVQVEYGSVRMSFKGKLQRRGVGAGYFYDMPLASSVIVKWRQKERTYQSTLQIARFISSQRISSWDIIFKDCDLELIRTDVTNDWNRPLVETKVYTHRYDETSAQLDQSNCGNL